MYRSLCWSGSRTVAIGLVGLHLLVINHVHSVLASSSVTARVGVTNSYLHTSSPPYHDVKRNAALTLSNNKSTSTTVRTIRQAQDRRNRQSQQQQVDDGDDLSLWIDQQQVKMFSGKSNLRRFITVSIGGTVGIMLPSGPSLHYFVLRYKNVPIRSLG